MGADYLLYSVGPDLKDDGGVAVDDAGSPLGAGGIGLRTYTSKPTQGEPEYWANTAAAVPHMRPKGRR